MLIELKKQVEKNVQEWLDIYNNSTLMDSGRGFRDYAKGRLDALLEIKADLQRIKDEQQ